MSLEGEIRHYLKSNKGLWSEATHEWYRDKLNAFAKALGTERDVASISLDDLREWRGTLQEGSLAVETVDGYLRAVKACFSWLFNEGRLTVNPAARLERPKKPVVPPKRISRDEVKALLAAARGVGRCDGRDYHMENLRDYALVRFFLSTGARASGVATLTLGSVTTGDFAALVHEKGKKSRRVYFDTGTAEALEAWLDVRPHTRSDAFWLQRNGKPLKTVGIRQVLERLCIRAKIGVIGPHRLRHTMAFESLARGVDPDILRQQLGHTDIKTTYLSYVRWTDEDRKKAFSESWLPDPMTDKKPMLRVLPKTAIG